MKKTVVGLFLASSLGMIGAMEWVAPAAIAQTESSTITYKVGTQNIPLEVREDLVAVQFKRTRSGQAQPFERLQQDLQGGIRSGAVTVEPVLQTYALISLKRGSRGATVRALQQRAENLDYVEETIPVLSRQDSDQAVLLPNELMVTIEGDTAQVKQVLQRNDLTLIRPVRFTQNRYLVKAKSARGLEVLDFANQLNNTSEIGSASPNFIQDLVVPEQEADAPQATRQAARSASEMPSLRDGQWHIDSRPQRGQSASRVDVLAPEAWEESKDGKGTVVAVLDSLIQWDHPDLKKSMYKVRKVADPLPNEIHGWDFVEDDADTRMSPSEIEWLTSRFRDTFLLSDDKLVQDYGFKGQFSYCSYYYARTPAAHANCLRRGIRGESAGTFHGTMVSGVIAAKSKKGAVGIAPKAKILPVRVLGIEGYGSMINIAEGILYAASRNADVINMSLGGSFPSYVHQEVIKEVLADNPNLVIVASSGNEATRPGYSGEVSYPAGYPGVVAVGATDLEGRRSPYSSYGSQLDVVAPGGNTASGVTGGILTTGGTFRSEFWDGVGDEAVEQWNGAFDPRGQYYYTQGTSFSSPVVAGVVALMKGEDRKRKLSSQQMMDILEQTSSLKNLERLPAGKQKLYYGSGLVDAQKAVQAVRDAL
ncbi:Subtilisin NAT [Acaryochloris thomasi RCC1774]|uniref:Subtilisin NAT n=1 Tax=Acaryochloris thomasi RCC1774 TaxID=1764569 RepID=A0A2W1JVE8_9CYAN|nr:S8 family serine peptidase [Acaryochloris thomasi]PZD73714.1 Subtilisin NAT [Acaryochloris thomasi RCC1774]